MASISYPLDNHYTLWYHDIDSKKWDLDSYVKVRDITSIKDFWEIYNELGTFDNVNLYLMKKGITPRWEDDANRGAGAFCYRMTRKSASNAWVELSAAFVSDSLVKEMENNEHIAGISIGTKVYNSILKIWMKTNEKNDYRILAQLDSIDTSRGIYKKHE